MDPIASLVICLFILKVAFDITKDALDKMLDTSTGDAFETEIREFVEAQPGVEKVDLLHTRQFGNKVYTELEIAVDRNMSLIDAHNIAEEVHAHLEKEFPSIKHVTIHVNPGSSE